MLSSSSSPRIPKRAIRSDKLQPVPCGAKLPSVRELHGGSTQTHALPDVPVALAVIDDRSIHSTIPQGSNGRGVRPGLLRVALDLDVADVAQRELGRPRVVETRAS